VEEQLRLHPRHHRFRRRHREHLEVPVRGRCERRWRVRPRLPGWARAGGRADDARRVRGRSTRTRRCRHQHRGRGQERAGHPAVAQRRRVRRRHRLPHPQLLRGDRRLGVVLRRGDPRARAPGQRGRRLRPVRRPPRVTRTDGCLSGRVPRDGGVRRAPWRPARDRDQHEAPHADPGAAAGGVGGVLHDHGRGGRSAAVPVRTRLRQPVRARRARRPRPRLLLHRCGARDPAHLRRLTARRA
jgi:hypothetical protein